MIGYQSGRNVKLKVDEARQRIAKMIDANEQAVISEKEITFTSGGTESNYLAMHSAIQSFHSWLKDSKVNGDISTQTGNSDIPHVISTNIEHVATDLPLRKWEKDGLIEVTFSISGQMVVVVSGSNVAKWSKMCKYISQKYLNLEI